MLAPPSTRTRQLTPQVRNSMPVMTLLPPRHAHLATLPGETVAVVDTFTPTFVPTSTWVSAPAGTILDYSSWRKEVGTNTVAPPISGAVPRWSVQSGWLRITAGVCAGLAGGAWLALA